MFRKGVAKLHFHEAYAEVLRVSALYRTLDHSLAAPLLRRARYPWEVFSELSEFLFHIGEELPWSQYRSLGNGIWIAEGVSIAENVHMRGPCIIGPRTEIRPGAFLRGNVLVGADAVVGNVCELKNCILFDGVQVPHYNYVGDSVLGYRVHLGAGAVTSNVKSDRTPICLQYGDRRIPTGRCKLGAMIGDLAEIGCHCVLNPGTVIGRESTVYPLSSVRGYVPERSIYKSSERIVPKREKNG